jgi:predicted HTH domain antitoxin
LAAGATAMTTTLTIELPSDLVEALGLGDRLPARAKQALVLDLLRAGEISQGKAAELLGLTRWDVIDLMGAHAIPMGPQTIEELEQDVAAARAASRRAPHGRR